MVLREGSMLRPTRATDMRTGGEKRIPWTPLGVCVFFFMHHDCARCETFAETLDRDPTAFTNWGSSVWLIATEPAGIPDRIERTGTIGLLLDEDRGLRGAAGVGPDDAALLVIDVYGQVYFSQEADNHGFPSVDDLALEARFPALQCPECDTPDVPGLAQLP